MEKAQEKERGEPNSVPASSELYHSGLNMKMSQETKRQRHRERLCVTRGGAGSVLQERISQERFPLGVALHLGTGSIKSDSDKVRAEPLGLL